MSTVILISFNHFLWHSVRYIRYIAIDLMQLYTGCVYKYCNTSYNTLSGQQLYNFYNTAYKYLIYCHLRHYQDLKGAQET